MKGKNFDDMLPLCLPIIKRQIKRLHINRDYDEFFQLGMIALWEACMKYDEEKGDFFPFAKKIIAGKMLDQLKKENRQFQRFTTSEKIDVIIDEKVMPISLQMQDLYPYLQALTPPLKQWVIHTFIHNYTIDEIAKLEGVTKDTVKSWRKRCLQRLRQIVEYC